MNIAVLGWGSLVWSPKQLQIKSPWHSNGPRLEVEFARISRDGRLTLVIHPGCAQQTTYWAMSKFQDCASAIENLSDREECDIDKIGSELKTAPTQKPIADWLRQRMDIDAVVWTDLRSNWQIKRYKDFSCEDALLYICGLGGWKRSKAEEYVRNAPSQIQTKVREMLRNRLGWSDNESPGVLFA